MGALDLVEQEDLHKVKQKSSGGSTEDLAKEYYAKVPLISCQMIYQKYKLDFEAFGYDPHEYLKLCGTNVSWKWDLKLLEN